MTPNILYCSQVSLNNMNSKKWFQYLVHQYWMPSWIVLHVVMLSSAALKCNSLWWRVLFAESSLHVLVVRAVVSVTWNVLSWPRGHEFETPVRWHSDTISSTSCPSLQGRQEQYGMRILSNNPLTFLIFNSHWTPDFLILTPVSYMYPLGHMLRYI